MSQERIKFNDLADRIRKLKRDPVDDPDERNRPPTEEPPWKLEKDDMGREFAIPVKSFTETQLEHWPLICEEFDFEVPTLEDHELNRYQSQLRDQLAGGQKNAILFGPPGTGKTTVAMMALKELLAAGRAVKASRFSQFKTQMEPRYCEEHKISPDTIARNYSVPDFLLLDEIGYGDTRQTITEHERRIFFDLISVRESTGRKTWICSNINRNQLHEIYGTAAFSRLDGYDRCIVANFMGQPNHRYEKNGKD